ncbi:unnamed protein product [Bursaphelenchus xylophilus]|uniref:(pine wood nematode) hypothetical protein n=1 Tax=Bursaphelenchus xylophilus TaxID=6326 RepID=A0A1I7SR75_BURXY|nr:unnamed protein product [Bursaphelenchus xylophilus]CAG9110936.1 unnamed protein product [Bursaphelenchus xylophilus]
MHAWQPLRLVLLIISVAAYGVEFDDKLARHKLFPLAVSAYANDPHECLARKFNNSQFLTKYITPCDAENTTIPCFSFIAVNHEDKALMISFRGSTSAYQVYHVVYDTLRKKEVDAFNGTKIGYYFYHAFDQMWNKGMKKDFERYEKQFKEYQIWITGHSLGGALASLLAASIVFNYPQHSERVVLYTYGEPRVGNKKFADFLDSNVKNSFRVIHNKDLVVNIPPLDENRFYHRKNAVFYQNNMKEGDDFILCNGTDQYCTKKYTRFPPSVRDHHYYYGVWASRYGRNNCQPLQ